MKVRKKIMRVWKVEGFKKVSYQSRKTGRQVEGNTIYLSADPVNADISGREVKEIFLSSAATGYVPCVGDRVNIFFNERGFIDDVSRVK